jgi:hypothetical protein
MATKRHGSPVFDVFVQLKLRASVPMYRRFFIGDDVAFDELHVAIQDICGWENRHAWGVVDAKGKRVCGSLPDMPSPKSVRVASVFPRTGKLKLKYTYDWGDSWQHTLTIARAVVEMRGLRRQYKDGMGRFPPEDCGGLPGWARIVGFLETGEDPWGEDVDELRRSIGAWRPDGYSAYDIATRKAFDR